MRNQSTGVARSVPGCHSHHMAFHIVEFEEHFTRGDGQRSLRGKLLVTELSVLAGGEQSFRSLGRKSLRLVDPLKIVVSGMEVEMTVGKPWSPESSEYPRVRHLILT